MRRTPRRPTGARAARRPGTMLGALATAAVGLGLAVAPLAAAAPSTAYHSPHYRGLAHRPVVTPQPLPAVTLGTGKHPALFVDAAGTAHLVYSTDGGSGSPDSISYCRLPRGQNACAATSTFGPAAPAGGSSGDFEGNFPGGNHDFDGPVPLVISNQLAVVDRRFPDVFSTPGGGTSDSNVFLWTSNDGGGSFTGGAQIGNNEIGGGAIVYGGASPSIGTISRTQTTGTTFQGSGAGQYTQAQALLGPPDQDYDGSLAVDGSRPVAAFDDNNNTTTVREWSGNGDANDASTWSSASFTGSAPRLAGGPGGVYVLYRDAISDGNVLVRQIVGGQPSGSPVTVVTASAASGNSDPQIAEDAAGHLVVGWISSTGIETTSSSNGTSWSTPQLIAAPTTGGTLSSLALAATSDGGGFAAYIQNPSGAEDVGTVAASAFGTQEGTGQPGLDSLPGGGFGTAVGDNLASATCTDVTFGAVHAVAQAGCFLHDSTDKTGDRVVSLGTIDINGVYIVPDAGAQIVIDPRLHTIDTVGQVSVILRAPGLSDITLWHGSLDLKLPTAAVGDTLFDLKALAQSALEGFPIDGDIDVKLANGGVTIPVSLTLPGFFGGVTGSATLVATLSGGLQLSSLEFKVPDVVLGVAELKGLDVSFTQSNDEWKGAAELDAPAGGGGFSLKIDVDFINGQYHQGSIDTSLPPPCGVPLDPDEPPALWLQRVGLGVGLAPVSITGSATFGIVCPGDETADTGTLDGTLNATFGNPITLTATAVGKLYGIKVESGTLVYKVPTYVSFSGESGLDIGPFSEQGQLNLLLDPANKQFAGSLTGGVTFEGVSIPSYAVAISNDGFGACLGPPYLLFPTEVTYHWGDPAPKVAVSLSGCPGVSAFTPAAASASASRAHAAASGTTFSVAPGTSVIDLAVTSAGGAPSVVLTSPSGAQITPSTGSGRSSTEAAAFPVAASSTTYVGIVSPAAGTWSVAPAPGSPAITSVTFAHPLAPTTVAVKLHGHGSALRLHYVVKGPPTATVLLAESGVNLYRVFATLHTGSGTLRFTPAAGAAGRRQILALSSADGAPRPASVVATFTAPGPPRLGRATGVRVTARGAAFRITWRPPPGATMQLVTVATSDGRHVHELVPAHTRSLTLPVIGFSDRVRVTIAGVGPHGAVGPSGGAGGSGGLLR